MKTIYNPGPDLGRFGERVEVEKISDHRWAAAPLTAEGVACWDVWGTYALSRKRVLGKLKRRLEKLETKPRTSEILSDWK